MKRENLKASCPVCGRNLFRGSEDSQLEGNCPKCGAYLKIEYYKDSINIEVEYDKDTKHNSKEQ